MLDNKTVSKTMITDALILIFGGLISWLLYSKSSRDKRFDSKLRIYEELSKKLSSLFLRYIEFSKGLKIKADYGSDHLPTMEYVLSNKFIISEKVNDISLDYLQVIALEGNQDQAREKLNAAIDAMRSELGLPAMDKIEQISKIETLIENSRRLLGN